MSKICSFRVEGKKAKVTRVLTNGIRFCCIRCARLCCKLGGPRLTKDDMVRL